MRRRSKLAELTRLETWVFIVKWQSNVTPRFLTESDKGTDELPTVIKSYKETARDLDFPSEDAVIVVVWFKFVQCHPGSNVINTFLYREEEIRDLMRGCKFLELRIVSV